MRHTTEPKAISSLWGINYTLLLRLCLTCGIVLLFAANRSVADMSEMAEKHIFTPGNMVEAKNEPSPLPGSALEKEFNFTGILITPNGKYALITENAGKNLKQHGERQVLKEGDQIKDMTIQEIGSNYLVLVNKENARIKMELYKGEKKRPVPVAAEAKPDAAAEAKNPPKGTTDTTEVNPSVPQQHEKSNRGRSGGSGKTHRQRDELRSKPFSDMLKNLNRDRNSSAGTTNPFQN